MPRPGTVEFKAGYANGLREFKHGGNGKKEGRKETGGMGGRHVSVFCFWE